VEPFCALLQLDQARRSKVFAQRVSAGCLVIEPEWPENNTEKSVSDCFVETNTRRLFEAYAMATVDCTTVET
jgi:hypothetical protein